MPMVAAEVIAMLWQQHLSTQLEFANRLFKLLVFKSFCSQWGKIKRKSNSYEAAHQIKPFCLQKHLGLVRVNPCKSENRA